MKNEKSITMYLVPFQFGGYSSLHFHQTLLQDSVRTDSFRKAILNEVKKNDIVLDVGSGTGVLSFFAYQAGAQKIYAIEQEQIIELAKKIAVKNKMDDKIVFIQENSRLVNLSEKVDVIVSECIGYFAFGGNMISAVVDARDKFLKEGGVVIPQSISLFLVPIQSKLHYDNITFWNDTTLDGIKLSSVHTLVSNNVYLTNIDRESFISDPQKILSINLVNEYPNEMFTINAEFPIKKPCHMHGLCGWFDVGLTKNVFFSTSPANKTTVWRQIFFPLEKEILLTVGSKVSVHLELKRSDDDSCSCFNWNVEINNHNGKQKTSLTQSTRKSYPYSLENLCNKKRCDSAINGRERINKMTEIEVYKKIERLKKLEKMNPANYQTNFLLAKYYRDIDLIEKSNTELQKGFSKTIRSKNTQ